MSIKAFFAEVCKSGLYKLVYQGEIAGYRAKIYNRENKTFEYYDFVRDVIKDNDLIKFLLDNDTKFESLELKIFKTETKREDGSVDIKTTLMTEEEQKNKQLIQEFKAEDDAIKVLNSIKQVYEVMNAQ